MTDHGQLPEVGEFFNLIKKHLQEKWGPREMFPKETGYSNRQKWHILQITYVKTFYSIAHVLYSFLKSSLEMQMEYCAAFVLP